MINKNGVCAISRFCDCDSRVVILVNFPLVASDSRLERLQGVLMKITCSYHGKTYAFPSKK